MAQKVEIAPGGTAKVRNPWAVAGLLLVTLGIYGLFWVYFVLRELRDLGNGRSDERLSDISPGWNIVVLILTGWLVIPALIVLGLLIRRVRHAQRIVEVEETNSVLLVALLVGGFFLFFPILVFYGVMQDGLNRVWRRVETDSARPGSIAGRGIFQPI